MYTERDLNCEKPDTKTKRSKSKAWSARERERETKRGLELVLESTDTCLRALEEQIEGIEREREKSRFCVVGRVVRGLEELWTLLQPRVQTRRPLQRGFVRGKLRSSGQEQERRRGSSRYISPSLSFSLSPSLSLPSRKLYPLLTFLLTLRLSLG